MATRLTEKLTQVPPVPRKFGEDGGKFYQHYDELADELDEDMVASLKSQLDGILIFAGLFAGVNSAFLAFTLPQMSADPADDTNALLFQIMLGTNRTITSTSDLPSASFSPPAGALPINVLFSLSLTLALVASFLAVLGQQWLVYYRKRSGGGAEFQRWEQLRRYLGAKRWRLELVLDDVLPSLLQIGLVIFCVAFILYLRTLSASLCYAIAAPLCAGGATIVAMAILAAWDRWCPFKTPLSHLVQPILQHAAGLLGRIVAPPASFAAMGLRWLASAYRSGSVHFEVKTEEDVLGRTKTMGFSEAAWHGARGITAWFDRPFQRSAEAVDELELVALKRVFCTSEDSTALVHAALNGQAIFDKTRLRQIFDDDEFKARLHNLYRSSGIAGNWQEVQHGAIVSLFGHIIFCCGSVEEILPPDPTPFGYSVNDDASERAAIQAEVEFFIGRVADLNPGTFAECPYRTALKNYVPLLMISFGFYDNSVQWHEEFKRSIGAFEPASDATRGSQVRPVEHFWFIAQGIKQAKAWDNFDGPEG
ncbi:hypothetical protein FRC04_002500 [Tulasnella sp. 424]|nr:hypothetical protein FRC04_002500 [Tulasnella sp. 424]